MCESGQADSNISIHALREEGDFVDVASDAAGVISIHALREEGDPHGGQLPRDRFDISIHALREEGDLLRPSDRSRRRYFYPRPPRGGRPGGKAVEP